MIGRTLGHYRILERIGAGGMGEVYRAHDQHLDRDVAVKVLPAGTLAEERARRRFSKEAKTLSRLAHPHIATVHDFDSQDGVDFLVMEYVAGELLSEKLEAGPLTEKELARLAAPVADALEEAHEQGIIHRDLKPANIKLTPKGLPKILDFGIARLLQPSGAETITESFLETGGIVGTLPYMSPEQLRDEPVDARSDIYSFGVVLYEMAAGQRPFQHKVPTALSDAILHQPAASPRTANPRLSTGLENIILKCLEKEPERRYQSAKELAVDLRRLVEPTTAAVAAPARRTALPWLGTAALVLILLAAAVGLDVGRIRQRLFGAPEPGRITSIAVLPLEELSGDPERAYFADGMTEALITELGKISALRVISRTSVMNYRGKHKPLPEVGRELKVDAIVEGSAQHFDHEAGITVRLFEAATEKQLWSQSYQRDLSDVLVLQTEVARAIAQEIKVAVTPEEETRLVQDRSVNPEAHDAYLKGRYFWNKRTEDGLKKALEYFQRAVEIDPDYALGYAGLADAYLVAGGLDYLPPKEAYPKAEAAARKALQLDEFLAEAHTSLAGVSASTYNWLEAEKEYTRAIELNPSYATAHHWYSIFLAAMGRYDEATAEISRAHELDPLSLIINEAVGWPLYLAGHYEPAIEQYRKTLEMEPNFLPAYYDLGRAYLQEGKVDDAIRIHLKLNTLSGGHPRARAELAHTYAVAGRKSDARRILAELEELSTQRRVSPYDIARIHAALGEKDQAFAWLEKAHAERNNFLVSLKVDPDLDPLRSDPRFGDLLRRLHLSP